MRRILSLFATMTLVLSVTAQTLNVQMGEVTYQYSALRVGDMNYHNAETLTILDKTYSLNQVNQIYIDKAKVTDNTVTVTYNGETASVLVAGNVAKYLTVEANGAHVSITQADDLAKEITYTLSGNSTDGEFYLAGSFKAAVELNGLTLTNPNGAPINIQNGKRIEVSVKKDTENTLADGVANTQKGTFVCKGHTEFKGKGTLNVYSHAANAIWSKEYIQVKNCAINILKAAKDGINCNQYFLMESGDITINDVADDCIQVSFEDNGTDEEDTGDFTLMDGTINLVVIGDAAKGIKADHDVIIQGGSLTITQTGNIVADTDLSYPTSVKADGDINISGGKVTINNTANGGKGLSAEGNITIDESKTTTNINITADGNGGTAETTGTGTDPDTPAASYKVYVSIPTSGGGGMGPGGGRAWTSVYLYKNDGTFVKQLTQTVTRSSGYQTLTFYYHDFGGEEGTYYFKSDNYNSRGTTYVIRSTTFNAPTSGSDIYYSISNSYTTSGTTRTYSLSNVTNTYGGTTDVSEDNGTAYNAIGIKADGNVTITSGTIMVNNKGAMSKSIKADGNVTINGGNITLNPSGAMQVINSDASYSSGIKTKDFIINDGTLTIRATGTAGRGISATNITTGGGTVDITNSGAGQQGTNDTYTAKGIKADNTIALNDGIITINMSGSGGKGIKSSGTYTQGVDGGNGPTLTVITTGSSLGSSGGGGGWGGPESSGSSAKAIKVQGNATLYGGTTEVSTSTNGAEGLESKTAIYIEGGKHYFKCYDDCINSSGCIYFNGGITVCYSNGNDAVDSNAGRAGAITIGNGTAFAYTSRGAPEEGFDCDNNSYIQITGTGIGISAGASQGGGGGWGGSSGNTISNAKQGYAFVTSSLSYSSGRYYTLADANGNNLVTYSFPTSLTSSLALFTATGMVSGGSYNVKYSTTEPTDATDSFHGIYLGSTAKGTTSLTSFTAK